MWNFRVLHASFQVQALFRQYFLFRFFSDWVLELKDVKVESLAKEQDAWRCSVMLLGNSRCDWIPSFTYFSEYQSDRIYIHIGYIYICICFFSLVMSNAPCIHWFFSVRSILDLWSSWFPCPNMKHSVHPWKVRSWVKSFLVLSLMRSRPPSHLKTCFWNGSLTDVNGKDG